MAQSGLPSGGVRYFRKYLFDANLGESDFSKGVIRDVPRWAIPAGGVYRAEDVLLSSPGIVQTRGGSRKYGTDIAITGGVTPFTNVVSAPNFTAGGKVFCISDRGDGGAFYISDISSGAASGTTSIGITPVENPPFGEDYMIVTDATGTVVPKLVTRNLTITSLAGTAPKGTRSAVWNAFLVLANDNATHPNRIWFSTAGDFTAAWDTTNSWVDIDRPVQALAVVSGSLLVFTRNTLSRIFGDTPPNATNSGGNIALAPIANIGTIDARSIVVIGDVCYFASEDGVFATNGTTVESITTSSDNTGINTLWTASVDGLSPYPSGTGIVCSGQWRNNYLIVSIAHDNGNNWLFLYYIPGNCWSTITNHNGRMFATSNSPSEKLYMATKLGGDATHSQVINMTDIFKPENGVTDYNSNAVLGLIETRTLIGPQMGLKRFGFGHATYYMPNVADVMTIKHAEGLDGTLSFSTVDEGGTPGQATSVTRSRFTLNRDAQALTLRFQQTTAHDVWNFYGYELEAGDFYVGDGQ